MQRIGQIYGRSNIEGVKMKEYILFSDDELEELKTGGEVSSETKNGDKIYFMGKKHFDAKFLRVTDEQWQEAIKYLNMLIVEYASIGWAGSFGLNGVLVPLKKRYEGGERTQELYDAIMKCE